MVERDTIINLQKKDKLIQLDNSYYLNHFITKKDWDIYQIQFLMADVISLNITDEEDEKQLTNYDSLKMRPLIYSTAHLSNQQFKDFVEKGGFRTRYRLTKYVH